MDDALVVKALRAHADLLTSITKTVALLHEEIKTLQERVSTLERGVSESEGKHSESNVH